ncbi:hypothetical protein [Dialister invisus]|uniref:hypothetical protein n=1 Tax=Dialister invisus TaxID=218538 RepID=UPI003AB27366
MIRGMIGMILWVWSHSPLLCVSNDENYGTITRISWNCRYSLFSLSLGPYSIYVMTYNRKKSGFQIYYILTFESQNKSDEGYKCINCLSREYYWHLQRISEVDKKIEKEKLHYHIKNEENRINVSRNKLNTYITFIVGVGSVVLTMSINRIAVSSFMERILSGGAVYALINIYFWQINSIKVSKINKSTFGDLKKSKNKELEILKQYYYDWQSLKKQADLSVGYMCNLQEWVNFFMLILFFLMIAKN